MKRHPAGVRFVHAVKRLLGAQDVTTANEQTPHVHFFTMGALKRLFDAAGLVPETVSGQFLFWPVYETFFTRHTLPEGLARADFNLARRLPAACTALWSFRLVKPAGKGA
jgi:hypothetical protein